MTPAILQQIRNALTCCKTIDAINLPGITPDRAPVLCGGLAILIAVFDLLEVDELRYGDAALREGLLQDMQARLNHQDIRHQSVALLAQRFDTDINHSQRVHKIATALLGISQKPWQLNHSDYPQLLQWASQLHEVGLHINYQSAHRHSAYIIDNAIMAGFNNEQQSTLAFLLLNHRKSLKKLDQPLFQHYQAADIWRLIAVFRIAVMLGRFRHAEQADISFSASTDGLHITLGKAWHSLYCLLDADLEQEKQHWQQIKLQLQWSFSER